MSGDGTKAYPATGAAGAVTQSGVVRTERPVEHAIMLVKERTYSFRRAGEETGLAPSTIHG